MSLNLDDSGVFRVRAPESGAQAEIRLPPKASLNVPAPPAKTPLAPAEENVSPRVHSADAPREVRVTIAPAPPPASQPPPAASPKIAPAIEREHRVSLPQAARSGLGYSANLTRVSVSARKLEFPPTCPCCNRPADMTYEAVVEKKRDRQDSKRWTFPYCGVCLRHVRQARWQRYAVRGAGVLVAIAVAALAFLTGFLIPGIVTGAIIAAAAWFLGERLLYSRLADAAQAECVCYGPAVRFAEYYATEQHFDFANPAYAKSFSALNEKKLL